MGTFRFQRVSWHKLKESLESLAEVASKLTTTRRSVKEGEGASGNVRLLQLQEQQI